MAEAEDCPRFPLSIADFEVGRGATAVAPAPALSQLRGQVVLVVNVACLCGFTAQYEQLEALYQRFKGRGFTVIGFPCNQFGRQEPWPHDRIVTFAAERFGVTFPIYDKINVNGPSAEPLFAFLKREAPGIFGTTGVKWNFTKFLCGRDGTPVRRYASLTAPAKLADDIEALLAAPVPSRARARVVRGAAPTPAGRQLSKAVLP